MNFRDYFGDWMRVIDEEELKKIINTLNCLYKTKDITPEYKDVFKCFHLCDYNNLKVILLGQDVYPDRGVATGIAFGIKEDNPNYPPSLQIIKESVLDLPYSNNCCIFDKTLESWEKQGILMLNSSLTTETGKVGVHISLWRTFIKSLLLNICEINSGIVFILMGEVAKTFLPYINQENNDIIKVNHPAYYARTNTFMPNIFKDVNKILYNRYGQIIKWTDYEEIF